MRDAFGGIFMIKVLLVFVFIYVAFTAISLNYAKAFRVKNKVIDYVEQNDIIALDEKVMAKVCQEDGEFVNILKRSQYNKSCINGNGITYNEEGKAVGFCCNGVVIENNLELSDKNTQVYNIKTYANWDIGALNLILALGGRDKNSGTYVNGYWEISGEAKVVLRKAFNEPR